MNIYKHNTFFSVKFDVFTENLYCGWIFMLNWTLCGFCIVFWIWS